MGMEATEGTKRHLVSIARRKEELSGKHKSIDYKRKRQEQNRQRLKQHIEKAEKKRRKTGFYKTGEGFNTCVPIPAVVEDEKKCRHCGGKGHKTKRSKKCPMNVNNNNNNN